MPEESTTPDLIALMREAAEAKGLDATMRFFGPASVYDMSALGLEVLEGHAAIREAFGAWESAYEEENDEVEEIVEFGNQVVLAVTSGKARPVGSPVGVEVTARRAVVAVWAGDLIERAIVFRDIDEARTAAERLAEERG